MKVEIENENINRILLSRLGSGNGFCFNQGDNEIFAIVIENIGSADILCLTIDVKHGTCYTSSYSSALWVQRCDTKILFQKL